MSCTTQYVLLMTLLQQPNLTTLTGFLLELKDRHQICYNLCKTAVLEYNLGCLVQSPGKTIKGYKPRAYCFSRTFRIMAKICGSTICSDNKEHNFCFFVYCLVPSSSQLNVVLTCDTAIWLWICNICTTYKREWCYLLPGVLRYLAHSREQYHKLNGKHTKSYLQCKAQGFFIVQIPLMNSTQISPLACSSKMNAKEFIYNYTSFSKN